MAERKGSADSRTHSTETESLFSSDAAVGTGGEDTVGSAKTLSSTKRRRDALEKELIKALKTPEKEAKAVAGLWDLWTHERGEAAHLQLREADQLMGTANPDMLVRAAAMVDEIMREHENWVEPINRMATILFLQGRYDESVEMCLKVLELKPWHFGALSGIVMCYSRLGNAEEMNKWANRALPPSGTFKKPGSDTVYEPRKGWVNKMIQELEMRQRFLM
mmetsp:Transcript_55234/g.152036  ORF Transcript_55234/g.152036 Transcript_55234/m.152036 type:complete len:220 (+) Transcript_55234:75-734(+)